MPRTRFEERYFHDLVQAYETLHDVLTPRGFYADVKMTLLANLRRPSELRDVVVELVVRGRTVETPVWREAESLKTPGRTRLRSVASVLFGLMMRATYDIESLIPLPGDDPPQEPGRARVRPR